MRDTGNGRTLDGRRTATAVLAASALPTLMVLVGILVNNRQIDGVGARMDSLGKRIDDLGNGLTISALRWSGSLKPAAGCSPSSSAASKM